MAIRADFEAEIVSRCKDVMSAVGLAVTIAGNPTPNADLTGSLGWAYRMLGKTPLAGFLPDDPNDFAAMSSQGFYDLCDFGEYRTLINCRNRWTKVNIQVGANALYLSTLRDSLDRRLVEVEKVLRGRFGFGLQPMTGGTILRPNPIPATADEFTTSPSLAFDPSGW